MNKMPHDTAHIKYCVCALSIEQFQYTDGIIQIIAFVVFSPSQDTLMTKNTSRCFELAYTMNCIYL